MCIRDSLCPPDEVLKVDDIVYYDKHAGHTINYNDKLFKVIKMQDVVLVE